MQKIDMREGLDQHMSHPDTSSHPWCKKLLYHHQLEEYYQSQDQE